MYTEGDSEAKTDNDNSSWIKRKVVAEYDHKLKQSSNLIVPTNCADEDGTEVATEG